MKYDFKLMQEDNMKRAVDACEKAGIGMTAMKTQGGGPVKADNYAALKLAGHFLQKGYTEHQARLKAVWENRQISAICSQMANTTILLSNIAAAQDKTALTAADHAALNEYAAATLGASCAGCGHICETAAGGLPVADVMRHLMYHREYGDHDLARESFRALPARDHIATGDYAQAELLCPQRLPIAKLMREAADTLA